MSKRGARKKPGTGKAAGKRAADGPAEPAGTLPSGGAGTFAIHEHIGRHLKTMFDEIATQPVPEKLVDLLEQLKRKQPKD